MITLDTADSLEQLGLTIFNPNSSSAGSMAGKATGLHAPDTNVDAQLVALIKEPMKVIDGRDLALGFKYTLNVTNALQLRAKHWYLHGIMELDNTSLWPCTTAFEYIPQPGLVQGGTNSFGWTIGLATCAAITHTWAKVIRMWLAGDYPLAVSQHVG